LAVLNEANAAEILHKNLWKRRRQCDSSVQPDRNLGFEGQPITFDNNFGQRFSPIGEQIFILFRESFRKDRRLQLLRMNQFGSGLSQTGYGQRPTDSRVGRPAGRASDGSATPEALMEILDKVF
jgi:hypothetical protein